MYFFDMRRRRDSLATLSELQSLLKTLQVPTFQIVGTSPASMPTASPASTKGSNTPETKPPAVDGPILRQSLLHKSRSADPLDQLMDELEEFDI